MQAHSRECGQDSGPSQCVFVCVPLCVCLCVHVLLVLMCVSENVLAVETSIQCVFWLQVGTYGSVQCAALEIHEDLLSSSIFEAYKHIPTGTQESGAGHSLSCSPSPSLSCLSFISVLSATPSSCSLSCPLNSSLCSFNSSVCPPPSSVYCNHTLEKYLWPVILSRWEVSFFVYVCVMRGWLGICSPHPVTHSADTRPASQSLNHHHQQQQQGRELAYGCSQTGLKAPRSVLPSCSGLSQLQSAQSRGLCRRLTQKVFTRTDVVKKTLGTV